jgi:hypothetical protein
MLPATLQPAADVVCCEVSCYAVRSVKPFLTINTLKMIYYSYFHSIMIHDPLFWGNAPESIKTFRLQKKII